MNSSKVHILPQGLIDSILIFSAGAFLGWIVETVYRSFKEKRFVNAGFLYGPFLPIYGFGGLILYYFDLLFKNIFIGFKILFLFFALSVLEYFSSLVLEKIFSVKLWDYSHEKFNLHGRICLKFSFYWTLFSLVAMYFIKPPVEFVIKSTDAELKSFISGMLLGYFILDFVFSAKLYSGFIEFINFQKNLLSEAGKILEGSLNIGSKKVPFYIRRMFKIFIAFPNLLKEFIKIEKTLPEHVVKEVKKKGEIKK